MLALALPTKNIESERAIKLTKLSTMVSLCFMLKILYLYIL